MMEMITMTCGYMTSLNRRRTTGLVIRGKNPIAPCLRCWMGPSSWEFVSKVFLSYNSDHVNNVDLDELNRCSFTSPIISLTEKGEKVKIERQVERRSNSNRSLPYPYECLHIKVSPKFFDSTLLDALGFALVPLAKPTSDLSLPTPYYASTPTIRLIPSFESEMLGGNFLPDQFLSLTVGLIFFYFQRASKAVLIGCLNGVKCYL